MAIPFEADYGSRTTHKITKGRRKHQKTGQQVSTGELEMAEDVAVFVVTDDVVAIGDADGISKTVLQLGQRIRLPKTPSATRSRAWHEPHSTRMAIFWNPGAKVMAWRY